MLTKANRCDSVNLRCVKRWTQADLAAILHLTLPAVNEIIAGKKAITPQVARSLGEAFGTGTEFWLNLESAYRSASAEKDHA